MLYYSNTCNSSTWETIAGRCEFKASMGYIPRHYFKMQLKVNCNTPLYNEIPPISYNPSQSYFHYEAQQALPNKVHFSDFMTVLFVLLLMCL